MLAWRKTPSQSSTIFDAYIKTIIRTPRMSISTNIIRESFPAQNKITAMREKTTDPTNTGRNHGCSINIPTPEATKPMAAREYRTAAMVRAAPSPSLLVSNHDSPDQPIQDLYSINRRLTATYQR
jgi:hypothetical protein